MAASVQNRFLTNLRRLRRRLLVFILPSAVAVMIILGYRLYPEWVGTYMMYLSPVALFALTLFAYSLLNVAEDLRDVQINNQRLQELQKQYGIAEGLAHIGSWVWDQKTRMIHMSDGCYEVFGLEKGQVCISQQSFIIFIPEKDQEVFKDEHRQKIALLQPIDLEFRYTKHGTTPIWVRWVGKPEVDRNGQVIRLAGVAQDITQSKDSATQLKAEKEKYLNLTELSADWDWELDESFRVRKISDQIPEMLKGWAHEILGKKFGGQAPESRTDRGDNKNIDKNQGRDINIPWAGEMMLAQKIANATRAGIQQTKPATSTTRATSQKPALIKPEHLQQARQLLLRDPQAGWRHLEDSLRRGERIRDFEFGVLTPTLSLLTLSLSAQPMSDPVTGERYYRGVGRNVTQETHQNLLLRLESDIVKLLQDCRGQDESVALTAVIQLVCETLNWQGGIHIRPTPESARVTMPEKWGVPSLQNMLDTLGPSMVLLANSPEAKVIRDGDQLWLNRRNDNLADFFKRYQMNELDLEAALLAPIKDNSKIISLLVFFTNRRFEGNALVQNLADILSRLLSQYIERERLEAQLRRQSQHDALTGLPNRKYLAEKLESRLTRGQPMAVLYIDLDRYKAINDTLGHQAGDQVLVEVARRFKDTIGQNNIASRVGGDEFILLLDNQNDAAKVEVIARKVLAAVERPFILQERAHFLSASIGVALSPQNGKDATTLIKCADAAMYTVKSEGRNDVRFYSPSLKSAKVAQVQLSNEFPLAIERGEVELHYQPVISSFDLQVVGMEGLIRWRHPSQGLLMPEQFLPSAEQSNVMKQLATWTIRRALQDRQKLDLQRHGNLVVSVNISPNQINEDGFLAQLKGMLDEYGVRPEQLRLELTENTLIEASNRTIAQMTALRRLGVQVMIDNFGTGYASLSYLRHLPISGLKIDQDFIRGLPDNQNNAAIMQAIMTLAEKLKLQVIAEGVETAQEMKALRDMGCRMMQGHFICAALPPQKLPEYLRKRELTGIL